MSRRLDPAKRAQSVQAIFHALLGRAPTTEELEYHVREDTSEWTLRALLREVLEAKDLSLVAIPSRVRTQPASADVVFVWGRWGERACGIVEYVKFLLAEMPVGVAAATRTVAEAVALKPKKVVLFTMPGITRDSIGTLQSLKAMGCSIALDVHHVHPDHHLDFLRELASVADDVMFHHPRAPEACGFGRYVPHFVYEFALPAIDRTEGLVYFGLASPGKRFDRMAALAASLDETLYCYGSGNLRDVRQWFPDLDFNRIRFDSEGFDDGHILARKITRHSVAVLARPKQPGDLFISGSSRFYIASGVPAVIDDVACHEDLRGVCEVVSFDDLDVVAARVRSILDDPSERRRIVERQFMYARQNTVAQTLKRMRLL